MNNLDWKAAKTHYDGFTTFEIYESKHIIASTVTFNDQPDRMQEIEDDYALMAALPEMFDAFNLLYNYEDLSGLSEECRRKINIAMSKLAKEVEELEVPIPK